MKFELYKDEKGEYRWRLKAANGNTLATSSEGYEHKSGAKNAIESVMATNSQTPVIEV